MNVLLKKLIKNAIIAIKFRRSSITKKILVACAGSFMIIFLPVHLATNLLILPITPDHEDMFRTMVHFLGTFPLIKIVEIVLMLAVVLHVIYTIMLYFQNRKARPVRYNKPGRSERSPFSRFMIHTGILLLIFIIIHFFHFYFVKLGWRAVPAGAVDREDFYNMVINLFSVPVHCILYIVLLIPMGIHLTHAFQSAFQTFGLNHPVYTPIVNIIGYIFAWGITLGFISIPAYFLIVHN
jgi:succinate dehydrogenase / fumarate reductase cytochrome b subunit